MVRLCCKYSANKTEKCTFTRYQKYQEIGQKNVRFCSSIPESTLKLVPISPLRPKWKQGFKSIQKPQQV